MLAPRLLLDDMVYEQRAHLLASSADTDHAAALLANRKLGTYWSPTAAAWLAGAVTLDVFPVNGQLIPSNWYFRDWALGAALAPDGWTLAGASGTIARGSTTPKVGSYTAVVTRAGTDVRLYQAVADAVALRGRQVTAGAWVTCGTADRAYVSIYDGTTRWDSSAHSGGGTQEWLSKASGRIAAAATSVVIELWVKTGNVAATFEGPLLTLGGTAEYTPHGKSADAVAFAGSTLAGVKIEVLGSNDNFSTTSTRASWTPDADRTTFKQCAIGNYSAWRVQLTGGAYSPVPQIQCLALGMSQALPRCVSVGFDPRNVQATSESSRSATGAPLGRLVRQALQKLRLTQTYVTEDELDALDRLKDHAVIDAMPFYLAWDLGEHALDAAFVWAADNAQWSAPLERLGSGYGTRGWGIDLEAVL